jgi:hypothetical protein
MMNTMPGFPLPPSTNVIGRPGGCRACLPAARTLKRPSRSRSPRGLTGRLRSTLRRSCVARSRRKRSSTDTGRLFVRGYGLVAGLRGTGSRDIPPQLRAHMIAELARLGFGSERSGLGDLKPETMLDSPDTCGRCRRSGDSARRCRGASGSRCAHSRDSIRCARKHRTGHGHEKS